MVSKFTQLLNVFYIRGSTKEIAKMRPYKIGMIYWGHQNNYPPCTHSSQLVPCSLTVYNTVCVFLDIMAYQRDLLLVASENPRIIWHPSIP